MTFNCAGIFSSTSVIDLPQKKWTVFMPLLTPSELA
jgi:hypothetical protein